MKDFTLEVCVDSVESALNAVSGGADRLELCRNLIIGGTTPETSLLKKIKELADIRIHALIRPRFGDFLYSEYEYDIMREEIELLVKAGADGVVIGCLNKDGSFNEKYMKGLIEAAGGKSITIHRAFDVCADPWDALEMAESLGVNTILTSGQEKNCEEGMKLLKALREKSEGRLSILAGAGVSAELIPILYDYAGITDFHMSGKSVYDSGMTYRNPRVCMGMPGISEFEIWKTDTDKIKEAAAVLGCL